MLGGKGIQSEHGREDKGCSFEYHGVLQWLHSAETIIASTPSPPPCPAHRASEWTTTGRDRIQRMAKAEPHWIAFGDREIEPGPFFISKFTAASGSRNVFGRTTRDSHGRQRRIHTRAGNEHARIANEQVRDIVRLAEFIHHRLR